MSLSDLPNELIIQIANAIGSIPDINSFVQTCRSVYQAANDALYRANKIQSKSSAAKWAAMSGSLETLKHSASAGTNIAASSLELLHCAAMSNQPDIARHLLSQEGIDPAFSDDSDWTPIFYACRSNAAEVVKLLLEHGVSASESGLEGWQPLSIAASFDSCEAARVLLSHGVTVNAQSDNESTPLKAAARGCFSNVSSILLEAGADPNIPATGGWVPLHSAAKHGSLSLVKLLLKHKAEINRAQERGYTALALAVEAGFPSVVQFLVDSGANVNTVTEAGWSPLCLASDMGHREIAEILLQARADHSLAISGEWSPMNLASYNGYVDVVALLLEHGALVDGCKEGGRSTLVNAIDKDHIHIANKLLDHGANIELRDGDGETPLMRAVRSRKTEFVNLLIGRGASASVQSHSGQTPLIIAAHCGHVAAVVALVNCCGGNVNSFDVDGRTALIHACMRGHGAIAAFLLEQGNHPVNTSLRDRWGSTAFSMAVRNCLSEVVADFLYHLEPRDVHGDQDDFGRSIYFWAKANSDTETLAALADYCKTHGLEPPVDLSAPDASAVSFDEEMCFCDVCGQCRVHGLDTRGCKVCDDGIFLICQNCRAVGAKCRGKDHTWEVFNCEAV